MAKRGAAASENSGENSGENTGLVPQPHGGALRRGNPGNNGRPPSYIRQIARESFAKRIPILERIADSEESKDSDRIAAVKVLADTGGVDKLALTVEEQPEQAMTPERVADMWERLQRIRTIQELEKLLVAAK